MYNYTSLVVLPNGDISEKFALFCVCALEAISTSMINVLIPKPSFDRVQSISNIPEVSV